MKTFFSLLILLTSISIAQNKTDQQLQKNFNVLFIAIDDMNNWVGAWGGKAKTPNIDKLANRGLMFSNAYCVVPACNASRTALFTGERPETTGQFTNQGNFRDKPGGHSRITLPQYLNTYGYETYAAGKLFHHPRGTGVEPKPLSDPISWNEQWIGNVGTKGESLYQDENHWAKWLGGSHLKYIDPKKKNSGMNYMCRAGVWGPSPENKEETGDWKASQYCADFLTKKHEKPFFLACGIFRPHSPQIAPKKYFDMYPLDKIEMPVVPDNDMDDIPKIAKENFSTPFVKLLKEKGEWKKAVQAYLACMSFADDCVGNVMNTLEKSQYANNTIVVFWTDHGWQLGHKNRWEKFTLWKQSTNAPLIIYYPNMKSSGKKCQRAVSFIDIYPTIVDLLGLETPKFLEGKSLRKLLLNPDAETNRPAIITYPEGSHSVVYDNWNYIEYSDGSQELYDHTKDPNEFNNLLKNEQDYKLVTKYLKSFLQPLKKIN